MATLRFWGRQFERFHKDECGMEALQTVVILAVAAVVLVGVHGIWTSEVKTGVTQKLQDVFGLGATK